ncbi:MAG: AMIN domain-containing protein [Alkalinema sp. RU_4_3]|nr:AMIN domain-containing protein [Alkalinema sp. RU_4_3]
MKKPSIRSRQRALHHLALQSGLAPQSRFAKGLALGPKGLALGLSGLVFLTGNAANAAPIEGWQFDSSTGQVTFIVPDGVEPRYFLMAQPARIVVDIPDTQIGDLPPDKTYSDGPIKRVVLEQIQPKLLRATLEMSPKVSFARGQVRLENNGDGTSGSNTRWSVTPLIVGTTATASTKSPKPPAPVAESLQKPAPIAESPKPPAPIAPPVAAPKVELNPPAAPKPPALESPGTKPVLPAPPPVEFPPGIAPIDRPVVVPSLTPIAPAKPPSPVVKFPLTVPPLPSARNVDPGILPGVVSQPIGLPSPMPADVPLMSLPQSLPSASGSVRSTQPSVVVPSIASIPKLEVPPANLPNISQGAVVPPAPSRPPAVPENPELRAEIPSQVPSLPDLPKPQVRGVPAMPDLPRSAGQLATNAITYGSGFPTSNGQLFPINNTYNAPVPQVQTGAPGSLVFGQPLPTASYGSVKPMPIGSTSVVTALDNLSTGGIVVPVGTSLNLRYGGIQTLKLVSGPPRQEILVLQTAVVDRLGKTIIPAGSEVLGQFETDGGGSRFITQALSFPGRNLAINAQSVSLSGNRKVSNNKLLQNSGIGAVAGAILGGISGGNVIGGAAAGAAITYAIAPKTATIEPGQLVEIRLTQDLLAAR